MTVHERSSMYLARDQPHGNGLSESRSTIEEDVIVIGKEQSQSQSQLQPQSQPQPQPQSQRQLPPPTTSSSSTSTYARDRKTDSMLQHPSAWRLRDDDDKDDDDDENEEEQPDTFSATTTERRTPPRVMLIGWDNFRTRLLLFLIVCLLVWACVFFPLLGT